MVKAYDALLFVYEFNLIVVKLLDVKTYIKFLSSVYEGRTDLLGSITQKIHMYSSLMGFSSKYFQVTT